MQAAHAVMVNYLNDFSFFAAFNGLCAFVMVNKNKLGFVGFQQAYFVNHANVAAAFHNRVGAEIGIEHRIFNIVQKFVVVEGNNAGSH